MRSRMRWGTPEEPPELDDLAFQMPEECLRAYRVVGIEEHRDSPAVWWLVMERIEWDEFINSDHKAWGFTRDTR